MGKQVVLLPCSLLAAGLAVWWVQPESAAGSKVLAVAAVALVQLVGALAGWATGWVQSRAAKRTGEARGPAGPSGIAMVAALVMCGPAWAQPAIVHAPSNPAPQPHRECPPSPCAEGRMDAACQVWLMECRGGSLQRGAGDRGVAPLERPRELRATRPGVAIPLPGTPPEPPPARAPAAASAPPPATTLAPAPPSVPVRPPDAASSPAAAVPESGPARLHPARAYLPSAGIPPAGVGAYGVLALRALPTPASAARLGMACMAYLASLPAQADLPGTVSLGEQMLTIWPLKREGLPGVAAAERAMASAGMDARAAAQGALCSAMLGSYDLEGGLDAVRDVATQDRQLAGEGPFLIGWSPSNQRGVADAVVLVVDMSDLDSQGSFDDAFLFWQRAIVEDPELWRRGFTLERLRLSVRDFVDHYGTAIEAAVKIWGG